MRKGGDVKIAGQLRDLGSQGTGPLGRCWGGRQADAAFIRSASCSE